MSACARFKETLSRYDSAKKGGSIKLSVSKVNFQLAPRHQDRDKNDSKKDGELSAPYPD